MTTLSRDLRRTLEQSVKQARKKAESGGAKAIQALGVGHHEPHSGLSVAQRTLRNRLRAHGRQLGDRRDEKRGTQSIDRLVAECAYEHWHRMLFARFLAENALLMEPASGMDITLEDCQALAREQGRDWLELAAEYSQRMLPQIFRIDDPVLAVALPAETQQALETLLKDLPSDVFTAEDGLGWVYQFWQSEQKDAVNRSGKKIGAEELPAVTQLFTEDYMVWFLLHNTLGAWWAGKKHPDGIKVESEGEARAAVALPDVTWDYLRFIKGDDGKWRPAAGTFEGWPKTAKEITVLDPCMGSGHFLVFALPMLVAMRMAEEGLTKPAAVAVVLKDNLFGLEIDPRCTQLAAFNLALAAWKLGGHQVLPALNLACSGLAPNAKLTDWVSLAGDDDKLRHGMERLYRLFKDAPVLGSLINPRLGAEDLYVAGYRELQPLLQEALAQEVKDDASHELFVTAQGVAKAAEILAGEFTLTATNVPYLGRSKQEATLMAYCERTHPDAKADLATCFIERCAGLCAVGGSTALVTPHGWLYLDRYEPLRKQVLRTLAWCFAVRLGTRAFETITGEVVNVSLVSFTNAMPSVQSCLLGLDVSKIKDAGKKASSLLSERVILSSQARQLLNPDSRLVVGKRDDGEIDTQLLSRFAECYQGIRTGDANRFIRSFWETNLRGPDWDVFQTTSGDGEGYLAGLSFAIFWQRGRGDLARYAMETRDKLHDMHESGNRSWGKRGVAIGQITIRPTWYFGDKYDNSLAVITPLKAEDLSALWAYCSSQKYAEDVRDISHGLYTTNQSLLKVPFDLAYWQKVAAEKYPNGLPKPHSDDPTQWLFNGYPKGSEKPLQVAVARLLGYRWPRQTGSEFMDCPTLGPDGLESQADEDGIVCISAIKGEDSAADRLRALLAAAYGRDWNAAQLNRLLSEVGFAGKTLDDWLRDGFFEQHSALFHHRPFIWHVWDGRRDGFQALVNYHRLAEGRGKGRKLLEKLTYAYLGDWIDRQRADQKAGVEGADGRLAAAEHLQSELKNILEGEPPYDLFIRWKPLHQQPSGWEPDINDGVRLNIRPFMTARPLGARGKNACILRVTPKSIKWDKDRGKEPHRDKADYPWFWGWDGEAQDFAGGKTFDGARWNDLHYSRDAKQTARKDKGA